jgi:DNA-binding transcriptional MocR family regulator
MQMQPRITALMPPEPSLWVPRIAKAGRPLYQAIADAIGEDLRAGRLVPGQRLPPQRQLAEQLGLDFTTVTRAYAEARRRGLVDARVGQGTFVRPTALSVPQGRAGGLVDMTMNAPPEPADDALLKRMRLGFATVTAAIDPRALLRYQDSAGAMAERAAGAEWLQSRLPGLTPERVLVTAGAQGALLALMTLLARPGDTVLAEALTYPGFKALAAQLGVRLVGVPMDADGIDPDALRSLCAEYRPRFLYCTPTLHNPTAVTWPLDRRLAVIAVASAAGVPIVEDDAYGMVAASAPPPLAALAPELVYHVAGVAKCLAPGLRVAYLAAPDSRQAARLAAAVRATTMMVSPLTAALTSLWIKDGTALAVRDAIRAEAAARQSLARQILRLDEPVTVPEAFHLWLRLPPAWTRGELATHLRGRGVAVAVSDAFAVPSSMVPPEALRLCLGVASDRDELRRVLELVAEVLDLSPAIAEAVV